MKAHTIAPACILLALVGGLAHAEVWTVTNTNDSGPGCLRWCIEQAQPGDEIRFDPSLDGQPIVLDRGLPRIYRELTLTGRGPDKTIIDGNHRVRPFWIGEGVTVIISGVTIRNGYAIGNALDTRTPGGAGIVNFGTLTIRDCIIQGCVLSGAETGGGIQNNGLLTLVDSRVSGNRAPADLLGGGIGNGSEFRGPGTLTISNSSISGNAGTGITAWWAAPGSATITVRDSTIADHSIGIVSLPGSRVLLTGSLVSLNGLGLVALDSAKISHSTFSGNGGGFEVQGGLVQVHDSTFSRNQVGVVAAYDGVVELMNSAVGGNSLADCQRDPGSSVSSLGHNLDSDGSCEFDHPTDITNEDTMLGPLQDNGGPTWTQLPLEGSPVIDRGWCSTATDQRGVPRPIDGNLDNVWLCDIGAVEYVPYCDEPDRPCDGIEFEIVGRPGDVSTPQPDADGRDVSVDATSTNAFGAGTERDFNCDSATVTGSGAPPLCKNELEVPRIIDGRWAGYCVPWYRCADISCRHDYDCPTDRTFCDRSRHVCDHDPVDCDLDSWSCPSEFPTRTPPYGWAYYFNEDGCSGGLAPAAYCEPLACECDLAGAWNCGSVVSGCPNSLVCLPSDGVCGAPGVVYQQ